MVKPIIIDVDFKKNKTTKEHKIRHGDNVPLMLRVFDDGEAFDLTTMQSITLVITRLDRQVIVLLGDVFENQATFNLGGKELAVSGSIQATAQFYASDGRVSTVNFNLIAESDPITSYIPLKEEKTLIVQVLEDGPVVIEAAQTATIGALQAEKDANTARNDLTVAVDGALGSLEQDKAQALLEISNEKSSTEQVKNETLLAKEEILESAQVIKENGDYAKTEGDRAKKEADRLAGTDVSVLDKKINTVNETLAGQLADTAKEVKEVTNSPINHKGAIITFIDDDCDPTIKTIWQPILNAKGIKISFAVITSWVDGPTEGWPGRPDILTLQEIKDLQADGHEILSHTVNHKGTRLYNNTVEDLKELEQDYINARQWMINNGLEGYDYLVYPGGLGKVDSKDYIHIKNVARKVYKYAIGLDSNHNREPLDNWNIDRVYGDSQTATQLKAHIDSAIKENAWLIICTHALELAKDAANNVAKLNDVIDYATSLNVPIMTFGDAVKIKGNTVAIGEYTEDTSTFISVNGEIKAGGSLIARSGSPNSYNIDEPITSYKRNAKTIQTFSSISDTFLNTGGIMEVYRSYHDQYSYATYKPYNKNITYMRNWNTATAKWNSWENPFNTQLYTTGFWTPTLYGDAVAGAHTYTSQAGRWTKVGNLMTVSFDINISTAGFDSTMDGNLKIGGLPVNGVSDMRGMPRNILEYNHLTFPTNYLMAIVGINTSGNKLDLYKQGNGVVTQFLRKAELTTGQGVVFRGQITYIVA